MTATTYQKPLPIIDSLTKPYWEAASDGRLLVQRCTACDRYQHYPRPHCVHCGALDPRWVEASGLGVVHTFTAIYRNDAPGFVDELPYVFAIIELDEGVRMAGNVIHIDPEDVHIDMPVRVCFDRVTERITIPLWEPAQKGPGL